MRRRVATDEAFEDALVDYAQGPSRRGFLRLLVGAAGMALTGGAAVVTGPAAAAATAGTGAPSVLGPLVEDDEDCFVQYPMMPGQPCPGRRHHDGHTPTSNGCGPEGGALSWAIPNSWGPADFKPACDRHDICYGTCNNNKDLCDLEMLATAIKACETAYASDVMYTLRKACVTIAYGYGAAVSLGGDDAYETAQYEDCECVHCRSDNPVYCGYLDACYSTQSFCMEQCKNGMGSFGGYLCGPAPAGKCGK